MDALQHLVLFAILVAASVFDLRERRIPNRLTYPAMLLALAWNAALGGPTGLLNSFYGLGLGLGVMLIPYLMGVMGAGDVKLMAAAGAFLGPQGALAAFIFTSLAGGVYALVVLSLHMTVFKRVASSIKDSMGLMAVTGRWIYSPQDTEGALPKLAYGVAIAVGTTAAMIYSHTAGAFLPAGLA
ncbi:A24 family peptidase [Desulfocurvus sp. DL9XJH121]